MRDCLPVLVGVLGVRYRSQAAAAAAAAAAAERQLTRGSQQVLTYVPRYVGAKGLSASESADDHTRGSAAAALPPSSFMQHLIQIDRTIGLKRQ